MTTLPCAQRAAGKSTWRVGLLVALLIFPVGCSRSISDSVRSNQNELPYRLVTLTPDQGSALFTQGSSILRRAEASPDGITLVGVQSGMCEDVTAVERDDRTIVVVFHKRSLGKNEFCPLALRLLGIEVTVAQPIDHVTTVFG